MPKIIRLILAIAFAIFIVAIIWALVANHRAKKVSSDTAKKTITQTIIAQPVATTASSSVTPVAVNPIPVANSTSPSVTATKVVRRRRSIVVPTETVTSDESFSASASASAGVNADGSTWANAN